MAVYNDYGLSASSDSTGITEETLAKIKEEDWYKQAIANDGKSTWTIPHIVEATNSSQLVISQVRLLKNSSFIPCGVLSINIDIDIDKINNTLKNAKIGKDGYIFIVNKDGYIISNKGPKLLGQNSPQATLVL